MNQPTYQVEYLPDEDHYIFESIGKNGSIYKIIIFTEVQRGVFNFGFGDYNPQTYRINDKSVSDNGDMTKVLATVIGVMFSFLAENPFVSILIKGSTPLRTQLYHRIINRYYEDLNDSYEFFGFIKNIPERFQKNKPYESFLIRKVF
jgi:hypothetical protein